MAVSLLQGASVLAASVLAFRLGFHHTGADDAGRALAFAALIGGNVALILVNRSWHKTVLGALSARNPASWLVVGAAALFATLAFAARSCGAHSTSG